HTLFLSAPSPPRPTLFPYTTLFRSRGPFASHGLSNRQSWHDDRQLATRCAGLLAVERDCIARLNAGNVHFLVEALGQFDLVDMRSEEHTSELQSRENLVCRLLLEKK